VEQTLDALCRFPGRVHLQGAFLVGKTRKGETVMKKGTKKKAHLAIHELPKGHQWAHKKGGKKKTKNLAKLTSHK